MHGKSPSTECMCVPCLLIYYVAGVPLLASCSLEEFGHSSASSTWDSETVYVGVWKHRWSRAERRDESESDLYLFWWGPLTEITAETHRRASFDAAVDNPHVCECMEDPTFWDPGTVRSHWLDGSLLQLLQWRYLKKAQIRACSHRWSRNGAIFTPLTQVSWKNRTVVVILLSFLQGHTLNKQAIVLLILWWVDMVI